MYRLVLYCLIGLLVISILFSVLNILPFTPPQIILTAIFVLAVAWTTNTIFARILAATTNLESVYISALILILILTPIKSLPDLIFVGFVTTLAMASKYFLTFRIKNFFNPVAIALVIASFVLSKSASWWIGNFYFTPFVIIGGFLIIRKIRREYMVYTLIGSALLSILIFAILRQADFVEVFSQVLLNSPLFFFASIMLTEPSTTPPTKLLQIIYGVIVGLLFAPQIHLGSWYSTPELALVVGNIFAYFVSSKEKLILELKEKIQISPDTCEFIFPLKNKLVYIPGQYMEWTLAHSKIDNRGNRRYFTLASSPTEEAIHIGVKFNQPSSSFKRKLLAMKPGSKIIASQRAGDFVLLQPNIKCVFVAGGIGITPFRSMLKYLLNNKEKRDIIVLYSNKTVDEIVYQDILTKARHELGIKTFFNLTDTTAIPASWTGKIGRINDVFIRESIPDYRERTFYLSGPHAMVTGFETVLNNMQVRKQKIKTDYFPGFV